MTLTPSPIGCPDWCTQQPGHPHASVDNAGNPVREHASTFGANPASVDLTVSETTLSESGPIHLAAPELHIWVGGNSTATPLRNPGEARHLAAALVEAAEAWERMSTQQ